MGRPAKLSPEQAQRLCWYALSKIRDRAPFRPSTEELARFARVEFGVEITTRTIQNVMHDHGLVFQPWTNSWHLLPPPEPFRRLVAFFYELDPETPGDLVELAMQTVPGSTKREALDAWGKALDLIEAELDAAEAAELAEAAAHR
jgi:hypothetical protein